MPRIRTLKPEHKVHRKVGQLSHLAYRLWVGMLTEADDEGRLVGDTAQLRAIILPYYPVSMTTMESALTEIADTGLILRYHSGKTPYISFPSWSDHQKRDVHHDRKSKLPCPPALTDMSLSGDSEETPRSLEGDVTTKDQGSRIKDQGSRKEAGDSVETPSPRWPSPGALVSLYNDLAPDEAPSVETLSPQRQVKARQYLREFPEESWWREVFAQMRRSRFLRGLGQATNGRKPFVADFDWLLTKGKDGTENVVKVADGRYRDD